MLEIPPWVYELRGQTKKIYKHKKRKKYEKFIEELNNTGRNLANTDPTHDIKQSETEDEQRDPNQLIFDK